MPAIDPESRLDSAQPEVRINIKTIAIRVVKAERERNTPGSIGAFEVLGRVVNGIQLVAKSPQSASLTSLSS